MWPARCRRRSRAHGVEMRTLVPGYPSVLEKLERREAVRRFADLFGGPAKLLSADAAGLDLFVIDAPHLYARPGNPYVDRHGRDWPDNAQRFAALSLVAAEIGRGWCRATGRASSTRMTGRRDWRRPISTIARNGRRAARAGDRHHRAQSRLPGAVSRCAAAHLLLPPQALSIDGVEYYGGIGFLKAGLQFADRITTVSPTYAGEIRTPEGGMGLDGLLRVRSGVVSGIVNGLDEAVWNPRTDPHLAAKYTRPRLERRRENKRALQERFGITSRTGRCSSPWSAGFPSRRGSTCCSPRCRGSCRSARTSRCSAPATRRWSTGFAPPRRDRTDASACSSAMTKRSRI